MDDWMNASIDRQWGSTWMDKEENKVPGDVCVAWIYFVIFFLKLLNGIFPIFSCKFSPIAKTQFCRLGRYCQNNTIYKTTWPNCKICCKMHQKAHTLCHNIKAGQDVENVLPCSNAQKHVQTPILLYFSLKTSQCNICRADQFVVWSEQKTV